MVASLLLLTLAHPRIRVPDRMDRAAFAHAMHEIRDNWTMTQVQRALGKPDDVWPPNDSANYLMAGDTAWCYGTDGHHTMPTLGYVVFRGSRFLYSSGAYGEPPSPKVIGESELRAAMRAMYRPPNPEAYLGNDSRRLIQVSNLLIPKGRAKALAILGEYSRVAAGAMDSDNWLFWLVRVMFTSNRPGGVFPVPLIGAIAPAPPKDLRSWPTFPVFVVDDVPVSLFRGADLAGHAEPFNSYLHDHAKEWTLRKTELRPPDDPFPVYKKLIASPAWRATRVDAPSFEDENRALQEILALVGTAYRPAAAPDSVSRPDYDRSHREFLALGCHWDQARQMYVRKGGSALLQPSRNLPRTQYRFRGIPRLDVTITFSRQRGTSLLYTLDCKEQGVAPIANAIFVAEDPQSGSEIAWASLNDPKCTPPWQTTKAKVLAAPPHKPVPQGRVGSSGFTLAEGKRIRFVVLFGGKRYASPVFSP